MKKKTHVKKEVTIEDLAIMVQGGFTETNCKIKEGFAEQGERIDNLTRRVDGLDRSMFEVKLKIDSIDDRIKNIENILGPLVMVVDAMKTSFKDHEMRILKIERKLQTK